MIPRNMLCMSALTSTSNSVSSYAQVEAVIRRIQQSILSVLDGDEGVPVSVGCPRGKSYAWEGEEGGRGREREVVYGSWTDVLLVRPRCIELG